MLGLINLEWDLQSSLSLLWNWVANLAPSQEKNHSRAYIWAPWGKIQMARSNLNKCLHFASFMVTKQVTCFVVHIQTHDGAPIQAYHQSCPADFLDTASHWALFSCPVVINLHISFANSLFISSFNKGLVNTKFHINLPNSFLLEIGNPTS